MRFHVAVLAALVAVSATVALAAVPADEITSLPGWSGALSSKQYSGYLNITGGKHLHYWLVESENDPSTDPVVVRPPLFLLRSVCLCKCVVPYCVPCHATSFG